LNPSFFRIFYGGEYDQNFNSFLNSKRAEIKSLDCDLLIFRACSGCLPYGRLDTEIPTLKPNVTYQLVSAGIRQSRIQHAICGYFCLTENKTVNSPFVFDSNNYITNDNWHQGNLQNYIEFMNSSQKRRKKMAEKELIEIDVTISKNENNTDPKMIHLLSILKKTKAELMEKLRSNYYSPLKLEDFFYSYIIYCKKDMEEVSIEENSIVRGNKDAQMEEKLNEITQTMNAKKEQLKRENKQIELNQLVEFNGSISNVEKIISSGTGTGNETDNKYVLSTIFTNIDKDEKLYEIIKEYYKNESNIDF